MSQNNQSSPMFNGVGNRELQAWNRCAIFFNLIGTDGRDAATRYCNRVPTGERPEMQFIFDRIKQDGYERTKRAVIRNNNRGDYATA